jgi:hypothetical protein
MKRPTHEDQLSRIAAFADATEVYAESLEDPDLAHVYWGKSLGLRQALKILTAENGAQELAGRPPVRRPRSADLLGPSASTPPSASRPAGAPQGW